MVKINLDTSQNIDITYRAGDSFLLDLSILDEEGNDYRFRYNTNPNPIHTGGLVIDRVHTDDHIFFNIYDKNRKSIAIFSNYTGFASNYYANQTEKSVNIADINEESWWEIHNKQNNPGGVTLSAAVKYWQNIIGQDIKNLLKSRTIALRGMSDPFHPFVSNESKTVSEETNDVMYLQFDKQFYRPESLSDYNNSELMFGYLESISQLTSLATDNEKTLRRSITTKYGGTNSTVGSSEISSDHFERMNNYGVKGNVAIKCDAMSFSIPIGNYSYELKVASRLVPKINDNSFAGLIADAPPIEAYFENTKTIMYGSFIVKKE